MLRSLAAALLLALVVSACATTAADDVASPEGSAVASTTAPTTSTTAPPPTTGATTTTTTAPATRAVQHTAITTSPGISTSVYRPEGGGTGPAVVLVPGGAWRTADPDGLRPLAGALAALGTTVYLTTYDLDAEKAFAQVACVVAVAGAAGPIDGETSDVVLAGHSAGAQITAVVALGGTAFSPIDGCAASGYRPPAAWVGMSGPYEIKAIEALTRLPPLEQFIGGTPESAPAAWDLADPYGYVGAGAALDVSLLHGRSDIVAFALFTQRFSDALIAAGAEPRVVYVDDADHDDVLDPAGAGAVAIDLIREAAARVG